jgi:hypothetical protein
VQRYRVPVPLRAVRREHGVHRPGTITFRNLGRYGQRLGNQLFQIAVTVALAHERSWRYLLPRWSYARYFSLKGCFSRNLPRYPTYSEPCFEYREITSAGSTNLSGYFQSEKYFSRIAHVVRELFAPGVPILPVEPGTTSVHVRRGDYVNNPRFSVLGEQYYRAAFERVPSSRFLVFSDDPKWCRRTFKGPQFRFTSNRNPAIDLHMMSRCDHHIISNSTFSWWGAWLDPKPDKIIIAPTRWFGRALRHLSTSDLIPHGWIRLDD